ncbi:alpha/beta hydrolase [Cypionkella aquatica]|uniref:Alpha/beta hydrolase n=1 Tax=Cypionkella aquatica TaxID=1756042 RepID=A0AA37U5D6_9RHOB|nr:alpha/beta hydrolase [Cypionkella aquatica]GLS88621.1 alpha/beta hydrolase [Cypionkella aquatica]GLS88669.1 alpha/beta hydrolase [Cypionkella aquatica]
MLLLIPGMMCDARMWGDLSGLPCTVHHADMTGADSVQALAAAILQQAPDKFDLAGLSMGGIVAMEVLRQAPERVRRVALLDTNPRAELPAVQALRAPQIARALAGDLAALMAQDTIPRYFAMPRPDLAALCLDMALDLGPQTFARQSRALRDRPEQTETLAAFKGPALVLMGAHDQLCPRDRHEQMHSLMPQSRFEIIANAGHLPTLENPGATQLALVNWLNQPV